MIGLDTNIMLRFLLKDDVVQTEKATRRSSRACPIRHPAIVSCITLMECAWFLRQRIEV